MSGFDTQNVVLGKYTYNRKEKIVCGCIEFTDNNHILCEFENLALSSNPDKKIETEISDIIDVLEENNHLINEKETKELNFSPIYDCSSSLNPMLDDEEMKNIDCNNALKYEKLG